jgi:hypothetical protein
MNQLLKFWSTVLLYMNRNCEEKKVLQTAIFTAVYSIAVYKVK